MKLKYISVAILASLMSVQLMSDSMAKADTNVSTKLANNSKTNKRTHPKGSIKIRNHINTKPVNNNLSTKWQTDASKLNPIMEWEYDNHGNPLIAPTYGPNHNIVYYHIDTDNIGPYLTKTNQAIETWNKLGVISLQPAPNDSVTAINISYNNDTNVSNRANADGATFYDYNHDINSNPNVFTKINIYIEPNNDNNNAGQQVVTIEHEIGHALGFDHDKSQYFNPNIPNSPAYTSSIMASVADMQPGTYQLGTVPLGQREANNLRMHYNLK